MSTTPSYLPTTNNLNLAYYQNAGKSPGIIFCGGFMSDMTGAKAMALETFCQAQGQAFVRFDYQGHGQSEGEIAAGTIGQWLTDTLAVIDQLTQGPQILIGSSMGGWLATLAALARPERIKGLITIAAAPDFTEELIWQQLPLAEQTTLLTTGVLHVPHTYGATPYIFSWQLIEEARQYLLLSEPIALDIPVRLFHGMQDPDVPWQFSLRLAENLVSKDVRIGLIKDGDHSLSRPQDLELLCQAVRELSKNI